MAARSRKSVSIGAAILSVILSCGLTADGQSNLPVPQAAEPAATPAVFPDVVPASDQPADFPSPQQASRLKPSAKADARPTVLVKVKLVELDHDKMRKNGFDFSTLDSATPGRRGPKDVESLGGLYSAKELNLLIDALTDSGFAKILTEPTLAVLSGHQASFLSGGEFPVPTIVGIGGPTGETTSFRGFGTSILVRPTVTDRGFILLDVTPEFSTINRSEAVDGLPTLNVRRSTTTLKLRDGQSFALTLQTSVLKEGSDKAIPFLSDLPIIGETFRTQKVREPRTLLAAITTENVGRKNQSQEPKPFELVGAAQPKSANRSSPAAKPKVEFGPGYATNIPYRPFKPVPFNLPIQPQSTAVYPGPPVAAPVYPSPYPQWLSGNRTSRLRHLESAFRSLTLAGLSQEAALVRLEIAKEKQTHQVNELEAKKRELAKLQAEVEMLTQMVAVSEKNQSKNFRLETLIFSATDDQFRAAGLDLTDGPAAVAKQKSDKPRVIRNFVPILRYLPNADRILEQCRKASGIEVLGSATHIVAEGQQATWQNGVEIPVPEIVPASGKSEQTTRTGFRLVGTNLSFKPETIGDGMIHLESGFEFSTLADDSQIVQVGGSSVPGINSRNLGTKLKLNPGGPVFIGLPQDDGTLIVVAVTATLVE